MRKLIIKAFVFFLQKNGIKKLKSEDFEFISTSSYIVLRVSESKFAILKFFTCYGTFII